MDIQFNDRLQVLSSIMKVTRQQWQLGGQSAMHDLHGRFSWPTATSRLELRRPRGQGGQECFRRGSNS